MTDNYSSTRMTKVALMNTKLSWTLISEHGNEARADSSYRQQVLFHSLCSRCHLQTLAKGPSLQGTPVCFCWFWTFTTWTMAVRNLVLSSHKHFSWRSGNKHLRTFNNRTVYTPLTPVWVMWHSCGRFWETNQPFQQRAFGTRLKHICSIAMT